MCVIFWDFDGTLVHSEHLWSGSMYRAIRRVDPNTPVTFPHIRLCNRHGFTWQTPYDDHTMHKGDAWWDYMNEHIYRNFCEGGADRASALAATQLTRAIIKQPENYHLYPDALSTLSATHRKGYRNILLSNNYPDLHEVLYAIGLLPYLDGVILSAEEGYDKPRKELFDIAKARYPAERYYMIGDNPVADIQGGNQNDMTTVLVHSGTHGDADHCFDDLRTILSVV